MARRTFGRGGGDQALVVHGLFVLALATIALAAAEIRELDASLLVLGAFIVVLCVAFRNVARSPQSDGHWFLIALGGVWIVMAAHAVYTDPHTEPTGPIWPAAFGVYMLGLVARERGWL